VIPGLRKPDGRRFYTDDEILGMYVESQCWAVSQVLGFFNDLFLRLNEKELIFVGVIADEDRAEGDRELAREAS
jgi:hypothetical protein